jgi:hypothetical protein
LTRTTVHLILPLIGTRKKKTQNLSSEFF